MASHTNCARLMAAAFCLSALWVPLVFAYTPLTIEQAASRRSPDFLPIHEHEEVLVSGIVSAPAIYVVAYGHLAIHDISGHGLMLDGPFDLLSGFRAGDVVEASGAIGTRAGLVVLTVNSLRKIGQSAPDPPLKVRWSDLNSFRHLGLLVTTEARVIEAGQNAGGEYLVVGESPTRVRIFLPRTARSNGQGLEGFGPGDRIQVTGLSSQYCPTPPYDRMFQIVIPSGQSVRLISRNWLVPPYVIALSIAALLAVLALWWTAERRIAAQRQATRALNGLGEEVLSASSPAEILEKLSARVPALMRVTEVNLYVHRSGAGALERIAGRNVEGVMVPLKHPVGPVASAAALCFRNRTLLAIPDTSRSPLFRGADKGSGPRAVMFVPMFAQSEPLGVLALCHATRPIGFSAEQQAAAQHFANQIATSLRLLERRTMREQLFRSEKLAATGQLISGIVDELQMPLESVSLMAGRALSRPADAETKRQLAAIALEARRASDIVSRLLSFARAEKTEAKPVELNSLLTSLIRFREREWTARGIQVSNRLSAEPVHVLGSHGQLEQVFLNLLVHAEQSLANADHRELYISTSLLARRVLVAVSYSGPETGSHRDPFLDPSSAEAGALGLGVCRGILQSHGGEIRFTRTSGSASRFEVELPVAQMQTSQPPAAGDERAAGPRTALVVESDEAVRRQLLVQLSARNCRVVPITAPEEAAQMVERVKFDLVFCSVRLNGMNWLEFFERVRHAIGSFVLLTEGYDSDLAREFEAGDGHILRKPVDEKEFAALLDEIERRAARNA